LASHKSLSKQVLPTALGAGVSSAFFPDPFFPDADAAALVLNDPASWHEVCIR
jgi:hypothetical protein